MKEEHTRELKRGQDGGVFTFKSPPDQEQRVRERERGVKQLHPSFFFFFFLLNRHSRAVSTGVNRVIATPSRCGWMQRRDLFSFFFF